MDLSPHSSREHFVENLSANSGSSILFYYFILFIFVTDSENNLQEDLFDQILAGKLEFPAPYWDNITDSAKVSSRLFLGVALCPGVLTTHGAVAALGMEPQVCLDFEYVVVL